MPAFLSRPLILKSCSCSSCENPLELAFADFERLAAVGQLVLGQLEHPFFFLDIVVLFVEHDFAAVELAFEFAQLVAGLLEFPLHRLAVFEQVLLGGQLLRFAQVGGFDLGLLEDFVPRAVGRPLADSLEQKAGPDTRAQTDQPDQQISDSPMPSPLSDRNGDETRAGPTGKGDRRRAIN